MPPTSRRIVPPPVCSKKGSFPLHRPHKGRAELQTPCPLRRPRQAPGHEAHGRPGKRLQGSRPAYGCHRCFAQDQQKGNTHLLVTTYEKGNSKANQDLTNIEIYKNKAGKLTYKAVGHYKLRLRGKIVGVGGVDKLSSKGTMYTFIVKIAKKIYTVSIDVSKSKKTADLKYVGILNFGKKYNNYISLDRKSVV